MASEYLKGKYKNVKPREKVELTRSEKRKNWWYYHKWHVAIGIVCLAAGVSLLWDVLGIGKAMPDYWFAYVGTYALPEDTVAALEAGFASFGADQNGDGVVTVSIRQYPLYSADPQTAFAAQAQLTVDLTQCQSCFFLLEDPERFQQEYQCLRKLDGSLPKEDDSGEGTYLLWEQCPALAGMELGSHSRSLQGEMITDDNGELVLGLSLDRRGFWTEKTAPYPEGCEALWSALTEGAVW